MGMSTPSHYNSIDLDKYKNTSPKYDWKVSKTVRIQPLKKTAAGAPETSPNSYKADESLQKKVLNQSPRYSYPKEKNKSFIQKHQTDKAFVPGPNKYNLDKAYDRITIGARRGYK